MDCPSCAHRNPEAARYCMQCGARLSLQCAACGGELPAGARFCLECGRPTRDGPHLGRDPRSYTPKHLTEKILSSGASIEGERKQVTILFADARSLHRYSNPRATRGAIVRAFPGPSAVPAQSAASTEPPST